MKKKIIFTMLCFLALGLVACNKEPGFHGGNISTKKDYDISFDYDFVAFGVNRFDADALEISGLDAEDITLINKPLSSETRLLMKNDLLSLGLLNVDQELDFIDYCEATGGNYFKLSLVIPNDPDSVDYGKQLIRLTNLENLTNAQINAGYSYNLEYESTILSFDQIINAAKAALSIASIDSFVLNSDSTGIFLWDYEANEGVVTLKFFVINAIVGTDAGGTYVDDFTMEWFDLQL